MVEEGVNQVKRKLAVRIRLIKRHRSYTSRELADFLGIHPRTIQVWLKEGLEPIDRESGRFLFKGKVVKAFLSARRKQRKCPLGPDEFYCPRCKGPRVSLPDMVGLTPSRREISFDKIFVIRTGVCGICNCELRRFAVVKRELLTGNGLMPEGRETGLSSTVNAHSDCVK
jgi:hypothetical protein